MNSLYKQALEFYFKLKPHQTVDFENYWKQRKGGKDWHVKQSGWLDGYWKSANHPHRKLLVDTILRHEPSSVLEIGCNVGINLGLINQRSPKTLCCGIDINGEAIRQGIGKFHFQDKNNEIWLWEMAADKMEHLGTMKSFDVIFSDASLIYIGDDKIDKVFAEVSKRVKKAVVFLERNVNYGDGIGIYKDGLWNRDYLELINKYMPNLEYKKIVKITKEIWTEWSESGYIVEAWR
jgi:SAM-dependent methyltransferase